MTVLLTRTIKDSDNLAKQLESVGINIYIEPMFNMEYLDYDLNSVELSSSQAVIFTSKNALNAIRNTIQKFDYHYKDYYLNTEPDTEEKFDYGIDGLPISIERV